MKTKIIIDTIVKLGAVVALIIAASTKQEYSFYTFLRWLMTGASINFAYQTFKKREIGLTIFFTISAIIFNPIMKIWFQKDTWQIIDYLVASFLILTIVYDWIKLDK